MRCIKSLVYLRLTTFWKLYASGSCEATHAVGYRRGFCMLSPPPSQRPSLHTSPYFSHILPLRPSLLSRDFSGVPWRPIFVWKNPCIQNGEYYILSTIEYCVYKDLSCFQTWPIGLPQFSPSHWTHCCSSTIFYFDQLCTFHTVSQQARLTTRDTTDSARREKTSSIAELDLSIKCDQTWR